MEKDYRELIHVLLVRPADSLNVGGVARAMMNLGFYHLHLVAPENYDKERAKITARWASDTILEGLKIHDNLSSALSGMQAVVGTSPQRYAGRPCQMLLPEWVSGLPVKTLAQTAILFGSEANGLSSSELDQCQWIVSIPSSLEYPAFNLAQSALIVLYELSKLAFPQRVKERGPELPMFNEYYQLDRLAYEVMLRCGFIREGAPDHVPGMIQGLFRRMQMDPQEMAMMLALFGRVNRTLEQSGHGLELKEGSKTRARSRNGSKNAAQRPR